MPSKLIISIILFSLCSTSLFLASNILIKPSEARIHSLLKHYDNKDRSGWIVLFDYWENQGDEAKSLAIKNEWFDRFPDYVKHIQGFEALRRGEIDKAAQIANDLTMKDPYNIDYLNLLAQVYINYKKMNLAEETYLKALKFRPDGSGLLLGIGQVYLIQKKYQKALEVIKKARKIVPNNAEALATLGITNYHLKKFQQATLIGDTLFSLDPNSAQGHLVMLLVSEKTSDMEKAKYHYSKYKEYGIMRMEYEAILKTFQHLAE